MKSENWTMRIIGPNEIHEMPDEITLEKPRLYLSMEGGKVRIEKGKNWRHPSVNPNKLECLFKLVQGSKFIIDADWQHGSD